MSMLDQLTKQVAGDGNAEKVVQKVGPLLEQVGGIDGLKQKFEQAGLGDVAQSWIGTGSNKSVSPDQVKDALGQQQVEQIANEAGVSTDEAAAGLSKVLPDAVDNVTPSGQVPSTGDVRAQFGS
ncbi:MAG: YidB family protein [Gaiellaceae bacterium]